MALLFEAIPGRDLDVAQDDLWYFGRRSLSVIWKQ